jgi:hypothetical protein
MSLDRQAGDINSQRCIRRHVRARIPVASSCSRLPTSPPRGGWKSTPGRIARRDEDVAGMRRRREDLERYYEPACSVASAGRIATKSLLTHEPGAMIYEHSFRPPALPVKALALTPILRAVLSALTVRRVLRAYVRGRARAGILITALSGKKVDAGSGGRRKLAGASDGAGRGRPRQ